MTSFSANVLAGGAKAGFKNGHVLNSLWNRPFGKNRRRIARTFSASLQYNNRVRHIDIGNETVTTLAGNGEAGFNDGPADSAQFAGPVSVVNGPSGLIFVSDSNSHRIRALSKDGVVSTLTGTSEGYRDGPLGTALFSYPAALAYNDQTAQLFVCDFNNGRIRCIDLKTRVVSTLAGAEPGFKDGPLSVARFNCPCGLAFDGQALLVADQANFRIRRIDLRTGMVSTLAGTGVKESRDGMMAVAGFKSPVAVVPDGSGNIYISDNGLLRFIDGNTGTVSSPGLQFRFGVLDALGHCFGVNQTSIFRLRRGSPTQSGSGKFSFSSPVYGSESGTPGGQPAALSQSWPLPSAGTGAVAGSQLRELFEQLRLTEFVNGFLQQRVTVEDLLLLKPETLVAMLPAAGPRARLETWIDAYKSRQAQSPPSTPPRRTKQIPWSPTAPTPVKSAPMPGQPDSDAEDSETEALSRSVSVIALTPNSRESKSPVHDDDDRTMLVRPRMDDDSTVVIQGLPDRISVYASPFSMTSGKHSYKTIRKLGEGAYGATFLAIHTSTGEEVVLKQVPCGSLEEATNAIHEAINLCCLRFCPHVCSFRDVYIDSAPTIVPAASSSGARSSFVAMTDGPDSESKELTAMLTAGMRADCMFYICIVMGYCDGGDLQQKIKEAKLQRARASPVALKPPPAGGSAQNTPQQPSKRRLFSQGDLSSPTASGNAMGLPESVVIAWMEELLAGLAVIHGAKLIHRDLKPANIFLSKDGKLRIGDFGVATILNKTMDKAMTHIGTPAYMAPEVLSWKPYDAKSDIWSLGCIMYEIMTLELPNFQLRTLADVLGNVSTHYNPGLLSVLESMLQIDPELRPSAHALLQRVSALRRLTIGAHPQTRSLRQQQQHAPRPMTRSPSQRMGLSVPLPVQPGSGSAGGPLPSSTPPILDARAPHRRTPSRIEAFGAPSPTHSAGAGSGLNKEWPCRACTLTNPAGQLQCSACGASK